MHISASLLAADYACLGEEVRRAQEAGVDSFHFDLMDGHYVPNLALTPDHLRFLRPYSHLPFHAHLELENPDDVLSKFASLQADLIIVQWDTLTDPPRTFNSIRSRKVGIGLGLNPDDSIEAACANLRDLDLLLLLGVYPGFGGQPIQPGTQERIVTARRLVDRSGCRVMIAVDGGVNPDNARCIAQAGADMIIMGTALFRSVDMSETVRSIRASLGRSPRR